MKKPFLLLIAVLTTSVAAQETAKFDRNFHYRTEDEKSKNVRHYFINDSIVEIKDFKNGKLFRTGNFFGFSGL